MNINKNRKGKKSFPVKIIKLERKVFKSIIFYYYFLEKII